MIRHDGPASTGQWRVQVVQVSVLFPNSHGETWTVTPHTSLKVTSTHSGANRQAQLRLRNTQTQTGINDVPKSSLIFYYPGSGAILSLGTNWESLVCVDLWDLDPEKSFESSLMNLGQEMMCWNTGNKLINSWFDFGEALLIHCFFLWSGSLAMLTLGAKSRVYTHKCFIPIVSTKGRESEDAAL